MGAYFCKAGDLVLLGIYAADEEGLTIMQIVEALGLLQPTVSMSVSALVEDGMVERERRGAGVSATTVSLTEKGEERAASLPATSPSSSSGARPGDKRLNSRRAPAGALFYVCISIYHCIIAPKMLYFIR